MFEYEVKIRQANQRTYIWGGEGINYELLSQLILIVRVLEKVGETVTLSIQRKVTNPKTIEIGTLQEGETFTIPLNEISGVFMESSFDTIVRCSLCFPSNNTIIPNLRDSDANTISS